MHNNIFKTWLDSSYLTKNNQEYIDQIYKDFLKDPNSVDSSWYNMLNKLFIEDNTVDVLLPTNFTSNEILLNKTQQNTTLSKSVKQTNINDDDAFAAMKILQLINSFRIYGHQNAVLDPLGLCASNSKNDFLKLEYYKFTDKNFLKLWDTTLFNLNQGLATLQNIYQFLKKTYCGSIGIEYMHILDVTKILWIQNNFESNMPVFKLSNIEQKKYLKEIIAAEGLEHYLGIKFPGVKRFSLEGGDVLIPMLKEIIHYSVLNHNIREIFFGMAHRGRLNVLVNVLGKNPQNLFNEFSGKELMVTGSGDVKYHQGLYSTIVIDKHHVHLSLLSNPSHLEIITPIIMGAARSKMDQLSNKQSISVLSNQNVVLPIVIHGDAAVSAQGVMQESLNMSNTHAYNVGGTVHIIINNQIGFTTSDIYDLRSTLHCTDIAKMIQAPILHVNADDVNAVIFVTRFALDFRNKFNHDVIIDLVCYRRHGHNESDEPSVTQPIMYNKIKNHPTISKIYSDILIENEIIDIDDVKSVEYIYRSNINKKDCLLDNWKLVSTYSTYHANDSYSCNYKNNLSLKKIDSQYLKELAFRISEIPPYITMHDRVKKIYHDRTEMALGKQLFDWGGAEILAYATLLDSGYSIRLSGEDVARGTFFHRHAVIHDQNHGIKYIPLTHIKESQGSFSVWDSVLSEESVLAFEYGYSSMTSKNSLVLWEAQFGDFSNGAQVVIDQFISSGEQKWNQRCGLIILLPHGYEGQGPEHSSCRIERYLQLCAEHNMKVCVPSTPVQIYHVLRSHAQNNIKKPLIIVSPKSLLRHPMVKASIQDLIHGSFKTVFDEICDHCIPNQVNRVVMCTGKIYYDLINQRDQLKCYNIAIIRIEQLYPFPDADIQMVLESYKHVKDFVWCQEEPKNQGAWYYIQHNFYRNFLNIPLKYVGRLDSAAPAVGYYFIHQKQQKKIIHDALDLSQ